MRSLVLLVIASACGRVGFDTAMDSAPPSGLVVSWPFDEGSGLQVFDTVQRTPGQLQGPVTWVPGVRGTALQFAGDGSVVSLGVVPELANLPAVTVSAWLNPSSVSQHGSNNCFFDKGDPTKGWSVAVASASDGDVSFDVHGYVSRYSTAGHVVAGRWTHVAATWSGSMLGSDIHLYVDGVEVPTDYLTDAVAPRADDANVQAEINCGTAVNYAGMIDELMVFDRVLTASELAQL